ncbi:PP2C family protein-serine/threonine phosphatase [Actinacidiphila guanduensis]|uniref:Stage II sporulation protein E (SpoIIE) n=1 Tax=Actinacidiphila guanduensis TaxID=310781 RepID=A0A1H0C1A5_9ACTN|nr:PP2C family protein-serine/threonine phosphatase [Actinacidiphila guanduensis]SDN51617.1 Stage II sporulation protein E (SpoIIE) [Actinacidiphila guanduensis]
MDPTGADTRPGVSQVIRSRAMRLAVPLAILAALVAVDLLGGRDIRISGLVVAVPALSAVFLGPLPVLFLGVLALGGAVVTAWENRTLDTVNFPVVLATVVLVSGASVLAARLRNRREHELAQARKVAEVTQRALLRPLPERMGRVTISSMYLAAEEEAAIGGDLYAAAPTGRCGARVLVGDVQGKGLGAVEVVSLLLSAFRRAARVRAPLSELMGYLDSGLRADLHELSAYPEPVTLTAPGAAPVPTPVVEGMDDPAEIESAYDERFVTAVAVDVSDDGEQVRIANCGHPPPLLIRGGTVRQLFPSTPDLPLGLGDLTWQAQHIDTHDLAVGDILLLYTDGVIEARDRDGVFYPLAERLVRWTADRPDTLLADIRADVLRHTRSRLADDLAMVALQRVV